MQQPPWSIEVFAIMKNRARGALYGLAIGDALGTDETLEETQLTNSHRFRIRALVVMDTNGARVGGTFLPDKREID